MVKNALYKVIRCSSKEDLGSKVVVQGGTFLNDAVLRAFEKELGIEVVRSNIAGLRGAYGAALDAKSLNLPSSSILSGEKLTDFRRKVSMVTCNGCQNHCRLTVSVFDDHRVFIGGNRCEKPITKKKTDTKLDLYDFKYRLLRSYNDENSEKEFKRGTIGFPRGLSFYELTPFWYTFFHELGFKVVLSSPSSAKRYRHGQGTIPSDTVCYPAKIRHGHVLDLRDKGVKTIFYPCRSYNVREKKTDNHYNCPVVAYYSEVIKNNVKQIRKENVLYLNDYRNLSEKAHFARKAYEHLSRHYPDRSFAEVEKASKKAYAEYKKYERVFQQKGLHIIDQARKEKKRIIVLSGRPYHVDPLINHDIDKLIRGYGCAIVSEDVIARREKNPEPSNVLNQWTYHSRLYKAANYVTGVKDRQLIQLVSFGCGVDAITSDEVRDILERHGKIYTQVKIDEVTNLGTVKIRLRSLLEALRKKERKR